MHLHRSLPSFGAALWLLAALPAATLPAQTDEPPPSLPGTVPAIPGTAPFPPGTTTRLVPPLPANVRALPPGVVPGTVPVQAEELVRVYYPAGALITDIIDHYAVLTGKRVIPDNTVQGNINTAINQLVPKSEAIRIIEVTLNLYGFALVPEGENIVKVLGLGKQPRNEGVPIFTSIDEVPNSDQIVSYLAHLRYLDPQETAGALQQYIPPVNHVAFTPFEKAGALIITDTAVSVRRVATLIAQLDLPSAPVVETFIKLQRADVTKALEFLNTVFDLKSDKSSGAVAAAGVNTNGNARRAIRRGGEEGQPIPDQQPAAQAGLLGGTGLAPLSGDSLIQGRITLTADVRTNRIHVVTAPVNMPLVERLLEEYDADTPFASPVRYPLRFVSAKDVLPILVQALAEPGADTGGSNGTGSSSTGAPTTGRTSVNGNSTGGNSTSSPFNSLSNSSGSSGGSSGFGGGSSNSIGDSGLDTQPVDTTPTIATVGNTKIIADQRSNTMIVLGGQEARDKVSETIRQLDVRAPQVVIRTVIGELSLANGSELGFNYLLRSNRGSLISQFSPGFTGTTTTTTGGTTTTGTGTTTTGGTTGTGTSTGTGSNLSNLTDLATGLAGVSSSFSGVGGILAIGKSFEIILSALESTSRFKTISRPMIFTSNNKKAIIASGQEIAVPTSQIGTSSGVVGGAVGTYTNVDYKNVVLQLEVVPLINSDHEITLDILQKIDNVVPGANTTVNSTTVPTIATRYLKSTVSAPNNSTIVLGGLITQDENKSTGDIPYLSRIPVLGTLFRSKTLNADRSELIILMHPEVVNTPDLLARVNENEGRRTYLGSGLEPQLLPNMVKKAIPVKREPVVVKKAGIK